MGCWCDRGYTTSALPDGYYFTVYVGNDRVSHQLDPGEASEYKLINLMPVHNFDCHRDRWYDGNPDIDSEQWPWFSNDNTCTEAVYYVPDEYENLSLKELFFILKEMGFRYNPDYVDSVVQDVLDFYYDYGDDNGDGKVLTSEMVKTFEQS